MGGVPAALLALQTTVGNQAVTRVVSDLGSSEGPRALSAAGRPSAAPPNPPPTGPRDGAGIQRLALEEKPVNAVKPPLAKFWKMASGMKGKTFGLMNDAQERVVLKLQDERPRVAIVGSQIIKAAGGNTPDIRAADDADVNAIADGVGAMLGARTRKVAPEKAELVEKAATLAEKAAAAAAVEKELRVTLENPSTAHVDEFVKERARPFKVLMTFATGQGIADMLKQDRSQLILALQNVKFQQSLGRILAADAFSGNADRAKATQNAKGELIGWFNEDNLRIAKSEQDFMAVAIDNAFTPYLFQEKTRDPFGKQGFVGMGSAAPANEDLFKREIAAVFDRLVKAIEDKEKEKPGLAQDIQALVAKKDDFVRNAGVGAKTAMDAFLQRGQGWKKTLKEEGETEAALDEAREFQKRKRYLRLIRAWRPAPSQESKKAGEPPKDEKEAAEQAKKAAEDAKKAAADREKMDWKELSTQVGDQLTYRQAILEKTLGMSPKEAAEAAKDPKKYKELIRTAKS